MQRRFVTLVLTFLTAATLAAQTAPAPTKKPAKRPPAAAGTKATPSANAGALGPNTPVIFVGGLCGLPTGPGAPALPVPGRPPADCVRAVTKSQFERMVETLGPRAQTAEKSQLAEYYLRALVIDNEARKLKLDQEPEAATAIWMGRVAALGEALHRRLQQQYANIPQAEVDAYYNSHKAEFEEATIRRIVIPKPQHKADVQKPAEKAATPDSPSAAKPAATPAAPEVPYEQQLAARKTYSEKLLERAKAGEPFDKLQKDAFTVANIPSAAPDTEAVPVHRGQLPPAHEEKVFALQGGQYSALIDEPSAYVFYKVESRRTVPLTEVANDVKTALRNQKEDDYVKKLFATSKPQLNPAYFAPPQSQGAEKPEATPQAQPEAPKQEAPAQATPEAPKQETPPPAETPKAEPPKQEPPKDSTPK
jgi:hypothetical protein